MNEVDFYMMNVAEQILVDRAYNFFIGLVEKGYLVSDLGICDSKGIYLDRVKYNFNEIEKVPIKGGLEGELK